MGSVIDRPIVYRRSRPATIGAWVATATTYAMGLAFVVVFMTIAVLLAGRARVVPILSGSMEPTIPSGGLLIATPVAVSTLQPGDIILYSIPIGDRHMEAHRILRIVSGGDRPVVITKGDANAAADPWTARLNESTVWKARLAVPGVGGAIAFLGRSPTRTLMPTAAAILLLVAGLRWLWAGSETEGVIHGATPQA